MFNIMEKIIEKIGNGKVILVLLQEEDKLSLRLKDVLEQYCSLYESAGFEIIFLFISEGSQEVDELACIRVPQIRIFPNGKLVKKLIGILNNYELEHLVKDVL
jgi:hypothetical protein